MRKSLILACAGLMALAGSAVAQPTSGDLAIGTSYVSHTPVGIRYWASNQVGIDVEVGFDIYDVPSMSGQLSSQFRGQLGLPINVVNCSDVWLHLRPFVLFESSSFEDMGSTSIDSLTDIYFGAMLEMEFWILECLSFSVSHGIVIEIEDGGSGGESATNIYSQGMSLGNAGFHFYLP